MPQQLPDLGQREEAIFPTTIRETEDTDEIELIDYIRVINKYKWKIAAFALFSAMAAVFYSLTLTPQYRAETTILPLDGGNSNASRFAGIAAMAGINIPSSGGGSRGKMMALLESRTLMEGLIKKLDLMPILFKKTEEEKGKPPTVIEGANSLRDMVAVKSVKDMIEISMEFDDAEALAMILNAIVKYLQDELQKNSYSMSRHYKNFVVHQLDIAKTRLMDAEEAFKDFQKENKVVEVGSQVSKGMELLSSYIAEKVRKEMRISAMKKFINADDISIRILRGDIQEIDKRIKELEGEKNGTIIIPVGLAPDIGLEFIRTKRELTIAEKIYDMLTQQYEMAKIEEAKEAISFQIIDKAIPPKNPFKPRKRKIVILAFGVSLMGGVFLAFLLEYIQKMREGDIPQ